MYCTNCGKYLSDTDRFCSNCGMPASRMSAGDTILKRSGFISGTEDSGHGESAGPANPEQTRFTPPGDEFKWNVHTFPGHTPKPTPEINFDWGDTGIFKKPGSAGDEIALDPSPRRETSGTETGSGQAAEPGPALQGGTADDEPLTGKDLEDEIFAEASLVESIPAGDDDSKRTTKVDKFYTFNKKNEEFQQLLDKEYERIRRGDIDGFGDRAFSDGVMEINRRNEPPWPEFNPVEHITEMARARELFFGPMEDAYPKASAPQISPEPEVVPEPEPEAAHEPEPEMEPEVSAEPGPQLPDGEPEDAPDDGNRIVIDYDELGEEPLPEEYLLPRCGDPDPDQPPACAEPEPDATPEPETPEALDAEPEPEPEQTTEGIEMNEENTGGSVEEAMTGPLAGAEPETQAAPLNEPETEPVPEPVPVPASGDPEDVSSIRERWVKYEEDEGEEEERRGGKAGKIVIGILVTLLVVWLALLGIRLAAPESAIAQFMDDKVQKILIFFTGENNHSVAMVVKDRNIPLEDKTGLIQLQIGQNQNDTIHVIKYNPALRYIYGKDYPNESLKASVLLEKNQWYAKGNGSYAYYDEAAVGAVIAYESSKELEEGQTFQTLEIGEIRMEGSNLFVWIAVEIAPASRIEKVLRIEIAGTSMNVAEELDA